MSHENFVPVENVQLSSEPSQVKREPEDILQRLLEDGVTVSHVESSLQYYNTAGMVSACVWKERACCPGWV